MSQKIEVRERNYPGLTKEHWIGKPFFDQRGKVIGRVVDMNTVSDEYVSLSILLDGLLPDPIIPEKTMMTQEDRDELRRLTATDDSRSLLHGFVRLPTVRDGVALIRLEDVRGVYEVSANTVRLCLAYSEHDNLVTRETAVRLLDVLEQTGCGVVADLTLSAPKEPSYGDSELMS